MNRLNLFFSEPIKAATMLIQKNTKSRNTTSGAVSGHFEPSPEITEAVKM